MRGCLDKNITEVQTGSKTAKYTSIGRVKQGNYVGPPAARLRPLKRSPFLSFSITIMSRFLIFLLIVIEIVYTAESISLDVSMIAFYNILRNQRELSF